MKFVPERLKTLRFKGQLSMRALAEQVGVSHTAISKYEKGEDRPRPAVLLKLAKVFGVSTEYFFKPLTVEISSVSYRKTSDLSKKMQNSIEAHVKEHIERYIFVEEITQSTKEPRLPQNRFRIKQIIDAEKAAEDLRAKWNLGSNNIANVTELLEEKGIKVLFLEFENRYDGSSLWLNGNIPVIVCNRSFPGDRQRFTLLHELAHMVLDVVSDVAEEAACHRFAAAFLAPREAMFEKFGQKRTRINLNELLIVKQEYGMSLQALIRRCFDLDIITKQLYIRVMKDFSRLGWRKEEPGDSIAPEKSHRFQLLVNRSIAENLMTPSQAMDFQEVLYTEIDKIPPVELRRLASEATVPYSDEEMTAFTRTNTEDVFTDDY